MFGGGGGILSREIGGDGAGAEVGEGGVREVGGCGGSAGGARGVLFFDSAEDEVEADGNGGAPGFGASRRGGAGECVWGRGSLCFADFVWVAYAGDGAGRVAAIDGRAL